MDNISKSPTEDTKSTSTSYFNGKIPYGFISRKNIEWITSERTLIGEGTYGVVYRYDTPKGSVVVKFIDHDNQVRENYIKEITFLKSINHPNVIKLLDVFFTSDAIGIVLPLRSTTLDVILKEGHLKISKSKQIKITSTILDSIIYQFLQGVIAIQDKNILNGDYKLDNILVFPSTNNECVRIEINDFGLANVDECFEKPFEWELFIAPHRPPELALFEEHLEDPYDQRPTFPLYTRASDFWVVGCIIFQILSGFYLFKFDNTQEYRDTISMNRLKSSKTKEDNEMTNLLKNWIDYDDLDLEKEEIKEKHLYELVRKNVPKKYVDIILSLIKFYPQDRTDIRKIVDSSIFDDIRNNKELCIVTKYKKEDNNREENIIGYCNDFLNSSQFSIITIKELTIPKYRVILINICQKLASQFGFETDLSGRVTALTISFLDKFAERELKEGGTQWNKTTYSSYVGASFLVAVAFYGEVVVTTEDMVSALEEFDGKTILRLALQIFTSLDFELIRSTSYDIIRIDRENHKEIVINTAYWLLQLAYMTDISSVYTQETIAFGIYLISELINNQRINIVPKDKEVAKYLLQQFTSISKYIDDEILQDTAREGVRQPEITWKQVLDLTL